MTDNDDELIPVFVPALGAVLINAEDKKGEPLTPDEVLSIRDNAPCIMMQNDVARQMAESRGYDDIDPENCWYDWQQLRRALGRKPDLDPGPTFSRIDSRDAEYQQTIQDAQASLDWFRDQLPNDGTPRHNASIKTEVTQDENRAFMWLTSTRKSGAGFVAEFFEVPAMLSPWQVGDRLDIEADAVMDWMINKDGVLFGGFSLRYQRLQLPEVERAQYDEFLGVTRYAELAEWGTGANASGK